MSISPGPEVSKVGLCSLSIYITWTNVRLDSVLSHLRWVNVKIYPHFPASHLRSVVQCRNWPDHLSNVGLCPLTKYVWRSKVAQRRTLASINFLFCQMIYGKPIVTLYPSGSPTSVFNLPSTRPPATSGITLICLSRILKTSCSIRTL